jgi:glycosyltransferase involved in cell wall biosynthesis
LQSLVTQETDFPFEIIVGDDASTDGTTELVQEYVNQYPNLVKAIFHQENGGPTQNYFSVHHLAQGEYIAHVDGDDYALPGKLQIQADFLDKNADCNIVGHSMRCIDIFEKKVKLRKKNHPMKTDMAYLLLNLAFFCNSSKMYRKKSAYDLITNEIIDFTTYIFSALNGLIGYLDQELGVYRYGIGLTKAANINFNNIYLTKDSFLYALKWDVNIHLVNQAYFRFVLKVIYADFLNKIFKIDEKLVDKNLLSFYQCSIIKLIKICPVPFFLMTFVYHHIKNTSNGAYVSLILFFKKMQYFL